MGSEIKKSTAAPFKKYDVKKYLGALFFLMLPLVSSLFFPEKSRYGVLFVIFAGSGLISLMLGGITIILKILISHLYQIPWLNAVSSADVGGRSGLCKILLHIVFVAQILFEALFCMAFSSFVLIYFMEK